MFANSYQSGFISIFYSVGSNPLALWDKQVKNGHIRRIIDEEVKSLVLEISGTNVATTYITCPIKPRASLGIRLPFLVMIVKNMKKYFTFEIQILDDKDMHRRFRVSNFQSSTKVRPFCTTMPIGLSSGWNQVQFNLADFTKRAYGSTYMETMRVQIHANVRIRRLYFTDTLYTDEELPNEFKLFGPMQKKKEEKKPSKEQLAVKEEEEKPPEEIPPPPSPIDVAGGDDILLDDGMFEIPPEEKPAAEEEPPAEEEYPAHEEPAVTQPLPVDETAEAEPKLEAEPAERPEGEEAPAEAEIPAEVIEPRAEEAVAEIETAPLAEEAEQAQSEVPTEVSPVEEGERQEAAPSEATAETPTEVTEEIHTDTELVTIDETETTTEVVTEVVTETTTEVTTEVIATTEEPATTDEPPSEAESQAD